MAHVLWDHRLWHNGRLWVKSLIFVRIVLTFAMKNFNFLYGQGLSKPGFENPVNTTSRHLGRIKIANCIEQLTIT